MVASVGEGDGAEGAGARGVGGTVREEGVRTKFDKIGIVIAGGPARDDGVGAKGRGNAVGRWKSVYSSGSS